MTDNDLASATSNDTSLQDGALRRTAWSADRRSDYGSARFRSRPLPSHAARYQGKRWRTARLTSPAQGEHERNEHAHRDHGIVLVEGAHVEQD